METITRFLPGRPWWAERPVSPPVSSKQEILRGFPSRGIPFPKEKGIPRCDVCPHPKPIKRGPLPGWLSYGTERRKEAAARKNAATDPVNDTTTRGKNKGRKQDIKKEEIEFFVRHDGHFKKPEKMRIVTFVKQYQRKERELKPSHQSERMDYGPNCDMKMLAHPTCGVNCYQMRQNVYKAFDELMSKQPEVVRIKPRPKEFGEMRKLALIPAKEEEATSTSNGDGNLLEAPSASGNDIAVTTEGQTPQRPKRSSNHEANVEAPASLTPSVASSSMELPAIHSTLTSEAQTDTARSQQPNITCLLFPQPRLAVPEGQGQTSGILRKEVRERQREKHWQRERLKSAMIYQDLEAKAKTIHDEGLVGSSSSRGADLMRRTQVGQQMDEKMARGKTQRDPEYSVPLGQAAESVQGRQAFGGGLQDLLKTAEEFERSDADGSQREQQQQQQQQLPVSGRSISPTELEYMKAAILNHNFYPRLVSSFIEQHAAGAPAETVAKLEQVRSKVMQSWNPSNSVECNEKIKRYQAILTKFESELEKPFQEAMDLSFTLEHFITSPPPPAQAQERSHYMRDDEMEEEEEAIFS
ncbi:hypothetical protein R1flu_011209 [Riccia fluitans]|uniref:KNOX1 domain-containing protein n=1 Tax=Riccia fluitans TaxID=41844 RepID=A0ABD1ZBC4_9MARC